MSSPSDNIVRRAQGAEIAEPLTQLILEEVAKIDHPNRVEGFWNRLRRLVDAHAPQVTTTTVPEGYVQVSPMTDEQAREFRQTPFPFHPYKGDSLESVLDNNPSYLIWLVGQTFQTELARFVKNPAVRRQLYPDD